MSKLPNNENAYIPGGKLLNYLLSEIHPVGGSKAKFFRKLGFNESNIDKLEQTFLKIAHKNTIESSKETAFGINYLIKGQIKSPLGITASVETVWFIRTKGANPSFVTAIPGIIIAKAKK